MSELQKYFPYASRSNECAYLSRPGATSTLAQDVYLAKDVDARLAAEAARIAELEAQVDALKASCNQEANDMIYANWKFAQQECELLQRAVEWCLEVGAKRSMFVGRAMYFDRHNNALEVPAEFAAIIKPAREE